MPNCNYCGKDPGPKKDGSIVWNGFKDASNGKSVCWDCRDKHYKMKKKSMNQVTKN
jgi:hypothetical protein